MTGVAVLTMLAAIVIIWGGLAVSVTALISRGRREDLEARVAARLAARQHMADGAQPPSAPSAS